MGHTFFVYFRPAGSRGEARATRIAPTREAAAASVEADNPGVEVLRVRKQPHRYFEASKHRR